MRKLTIVYHHAGGGHRSAADALQATLSTQEHPWDISLLDIQELLDPLDLIRRATGLRIQDTYNLILRRGWTRFTPQLLAILQATIRLYHSPIVKALRAYWAQHPADLQERRDAHQDTPGSGGNSKPGYGHGAFLN